MKAISPEKHRQNLRSLLSELNSLAWSMADSNPMIQGSFYLTYKTCSKPNCCCKKGKKHGPFPALSQCVNGKRKLTMVKKEDADTVMPKAEAYKQFQKRFAKLRKLFPAIEELLQNVRTELTEQYPCNNKIQ